jgi:pimeloyl-ACP methyl ester carboxylesterase
VSTRLSTVVLFGLACACNGDSSTDPDPEPDQSVVTERTVDPTETGAGISSTTGMHVVLTPRTSGRKQTLLVFLPGTGGRPEFYRSVLRHAAERGHHAIGLAYPNTDGVNELCATMPSPTCQEDARVEVITGTPRSALVNVNVANSIDNRLRAVLATLDTRFPTEGWDSYLANGEPRWDRVIVAGHSQGGGHAAMIARLRVVSRAILFSSTEPAPWTSTMFATPRSRLFGFAHRSEPGYAGITASWNLMQLAGPIMSVDGAAAPVGGSHQLQTAVATCRPVALLDPPHNCVVTDAVTPLGPDGRPVFALAWTYLLEG